MQIATEESGATALKVLHIGKYFPPYAGGMETYLRDLMTAQAKQGLAPSALVHQSHISLSSNSETYTSSKQMLGITRAAVWARFLFTPISPTFPWLLQKTIKREQPDILHIHMPNVSAFWCLLLPSARKKPWVVHWHADVLASTHSRGLRTFYSYYRLFERALLKGCARIIVTSQPYLESSKPLREFRDKCEVVPLGLDPTKLVSPISTTSTAKRSDALKVLAIGRLTYYKGFEYLIKAIARTDGVELHLVGTGELKKHLRKLATELGAGSKIIFNGRLSDEALAAQFGACDCVCLPSIERTEAFGMVLLEAMSLGKATIVSKVAGSGMGWVVEHGQTGLQVTPASSTSRVQSLHYLNENRDKLKAFGERGRDRFEHLFHIDKSSDKVTGIYLKIIGKSATTRPNKNNDHSHG